MKKNILILLVFVVLSAVVFVFATPGSESDPVITLSYFENKINELSTSIDEKLADIDLSSGVNAPVVQKSEGHIFKAHKVDAGTDIILGDSTEFIVRRGSASVIDPLGNSIPDLTSGKDIAANTIVPQNHHMLNPVADGRGLRVLDGDDFWIMIKGPFELN